MKSIMEGPAPGSHRVSGRGGTDRCKYSGTDDYADTEEYYVCRAKGFLKLVVLFVAFREYVGEILDPEQLFSELHQNLTACPSQNTKAIAMI